MPKDFYSRDLNPLVFSRKKENVQYASKYLTCDRNEVGSFK
jgi:hypothetical protein